MTLVYEDRGSENHLTRMCEARVQTDLFEPKVEVTATTVALKPTHGNPVPERDISEAIARTLHSDIADFFLFDGEMLTRFEESLRSDSTRSQTVKRSIERVLGLPAPTVASAGRQRNAAGRRRRDPQGGQPQA